MTINRSKATTFQNSVRPALNSSRLCSKPTSKTSKIFCIALLPFCFANSYVRAHAARRMDTPPGFSRQLKFSFQLPVDGRSYCNQPNNNTTTHNECIYLHRTPAGDSASAGGSSCYTYAESYRELGILDYDAGDRPLWRSIFLPPISNRQPLGGITPDGHLLHDIRPYCDTLMDQEAALFPAQPSPAYQACQKGKHYFTHWWKYEPGGGFRNQQNEILLNKK